jgi:hypothetical protein
VDNEMPRIALERRTRLRPSGNGIRARQIIVDSFHERFLLRTPPRVSESLDRECTLLARASYSSEKGAARGSSIVGNLGQGKWRFAVLTESLDRSVKADVDRGATTRSPR